jgi:hypothetical protein
MANQDVNAEPGNALMSAKDRATGPILVGYLHGATNGWAAPCVFLAALGCWLPPPG